MKKSTIAVLLSAFIFPGSGHLYLKKYMAGVLLAGFSFTVIYFLLSKVMEKALVISEKIQSGEVQLDIETINELVSQQSSGIDVQLLNIAAIALIICWLIGIIDSFRVGHLRDKNDKQIDNG